MYAVAKHHCASQPINCVICTAGWLQHRPLVKPSGSVLLPLALCMQAADSCAFAAAALHRAGALKLLTTA
jgi:hypothetical protein